jgi:polyketide synthase 12/myxalamid-type polyketide synthase MxaB
MAAAVGSRREDQWAVGGIYTFSAAQALAALEQVLAQDMTQVGIFAADWTKSERQSNPREQRFVAGLLSQPRQDVALEQTAQGLDVRQQLEQAPPQRRRRILQNHVRQQTMRVLGLAPDQGFDMQQPLQEFGLDSLMAVELRNLLGAGLALRRALPATLVFDYPTVEALTGFLADELFPAKPGIPPKAVNVPVRDEVGAISAAPGEVSLEQLEALTDEEAEALLLAQLRQLQDK